MAEVRPKQSNADQKREGLFSAAADAEALYNAMKNLGTDEDTIINILTNRTFEQRQLIAAQYKLKYDKNLVDALKKDLSGDFENAIVNLMYPVSEVLANDLHKAMKGPGTNEDVLIEILATTEKGDDIKKLNATYKHLYEKTLQSALADEVSGYFGQFLSALAMEIRTEDRDVESCAKILISGGETEWGHILSTETYPNLRLIFKEYERLASKTVEEAIDDQFSGDIKKAFQAVVKTTKNIHAYLAERLYGSMKGAGTDENTLTRIIVTRKEKDLPLIIRQYDKTYSKSLREAIDGDTSGDYERTLLSLING